MLAKKVARKTEVQNDCQMLSKYAAPSTLHFQRLGRHSDNRGAISGKRLDIFMGMKEKHDEPNT